MSTHESARAHVKSGSFVLNNGMPGSRLSGDNPGKTGMVGRYAMSTILHINYNYVYGIIRNN